MSARDPKRVMRRVAMAETANVLKLASLCWGHNFANFHTFWPEAPDRSFVSPSRRFMNAMTFTVDALVS
jgi:hypothetical protein